MDRELREDLELIENAVKRARVQRFRALMELLPGCSEEELNRVLDETAYLLTQMNRGKNEKIL